MFLDFFIDIYIICINTIHNNYSCTYMYKPSLGCCPVTMAVGETTSGKSALKHMVSQSSAEFVVSHLTKTKISLGWDDPTHASILKRPLVCEFDGIGTQTHERGVKKPETSLLLTVNFMLEDDIKQTKEITNRQRAFT